MTAASMNFSFEIPRDAFSSGVRIGHIEKLKGIKGMLTSCRAIDGLALRMNQIPGRDSKRATNILMASDGLPYVSHRFPHGPVIPSLSAQFPCRLQASCNHVPR